MRGKIVCFGEGEHKISRKWTSYQHILHKQRNDSMEGWCTTSIISHILSIFSYCTLLYGLNNYGPFSGIL